MHLLGKKLRIKKFSFKQMEQMSNKFGVPIQNLKIKNINDTSIFNNVLLKQIYNSPGELFLITDFLHKKIIC